MYASGEPDADSIYINLGTGAFIQRLHGNTPPRVPGMLGSVLWQGEGRVLYVLEGTINGAGSALLWLRERLGISEKMMLARMPDWLSDYPDVPLFLNGIAGLGSPYWIPGLQSRFIGKGDNTQKMIAVAESVIFLLCVNLERMINIHMAAKRIVISGGFARWDGICQRLANLSGLPVERPAQHEATARGLACLIGARERESAKSIAYMPKNDARLNLRYKHWLIELEKSIQ